MELDEIIYAAITADQTLADECSCIKSTCIEVAPMDDDNAPLPYIIVMEEPSQNDQGTKDSVWESDVDLVQVGVEISAESPNAVKRLRRLVRKAIRTYVESMTQTIPYLRQASRNGIAWDWTKPCYYDILHYQCDMDIDLDDDDNEQEEV